MFKHGKTHLSICITIFANYEKIYILGTQILLFQIWRKVGCCCCAAKIFQLFIGCTSPNLPLCCIIIHPRTPKIPGSIKQKIQKHRNPTIPVKHSRGTNYPSNTLTHIYVKFVVQRWTNKGILPTVIMFCHVLLTFGYFCYLLPSFASFCRLSVNFGKRHFGATYLRHQHSSANTVQKLQKLDK